VQTLSRCPDSFLIVVYYNESEFLSQARGRASNPHRLSVMKAFTMDEYKKIVAKLP
jgi:hypothetical protein